MVLKPTGQTRGPPRLALLWVLLPPGHGEYAARTSKQEDHIKPTSLADEMLNRSSRPSVCSLLPA